MPETSLHTDRDQGAGRAGNGSDTPERAAAFSSGTLQGVWPPLAAFVLGSVTTVGAGMLDGGRSPWSQLLPVALLLLLVGWICWRTSGRWGVAARWGQTRRSATASRRHTRSILDSMAHAVFVVDAHGLIRLVNRAAVALTGYAESELLGREAGSLFAGSGEEERFHFSPEQVKLLIRQGIIGEREFTLGAANGEGIPVALFTSLLMLDDGGPTETILVCNDITERRLAEARLLHQQNHLREMVRQRTEKLEAAMEEANAAAQIKSTFLANMSHEIRSPMTAIIGMTDLLLHSRLSGEQRERLLIVQNASNSLLTLINEILDLSKIESGQLQLERISFPIHATVENVCELIAIKAHEKGLELFCYISPDTPEMVIGDPNRLTQILMNLVSNAIKFTQEGEVTLLVQRADRKQSHQAGGEAGEEAGEEARERGGAAELIFSVADTGIGIPPALQERIFERFTQGDGSTTRRFGGSGLGLTICRSLAELMGGMIRVESEEGEGSVFHVTLKFGVSRKSLASAGREEERNLPRIADQVLVGIRVLMADRNPTGRAIVAEILQGAGAVVEEATDWIALQGAVERAREQNRPWDVLLVDRRIFDPHVEELLALQGHPGWSGRLAVLIPSHVRLEELAHAADFSAFMPVSKPVKRHAVLCALTALLGGALLEARQECDDAVFVPSEPLSPLRVLLAEDLEENRKLTAAILERAGHEVIQVKDGQEALDRMESGVLFDLVLTDLHMPGMDGYALANRIRADGGPNAMVPIVAVTARALPGEKALCLASGMDEFLVKPFRPVELLNVASRALLRRRPASMPARGGELPPVLKPVGDAVRFQEASSLYLKGPRLLLEPLRGVLEEKNPKRAREACESIKKLAIALGAERVRIKAVRLGVAARAEEWLKAGKIYRELETECVAVYESLIDNLPVLPADPAAEPVVVSPPGTDEIPDPAC